MQKNQRLLNLDILRLASAVLVMLFHYGFRMPISGEGGGLGFPVLSPFAMWFDTGLLIFFAISGYVITLSAEGRSAYDFAVGRVARLWPTFLICASITALILTLWPVPTLPEPTLRQWLAHIVILSRALGQPFLDGAYWTIAYEIIFYGWIFLLIAIGIFERHWKPVVLVWLAISVINETMLHSGALQKLMITQYSGFFAFGLVLFRTQRDARWTSFAVLAAAMAWAFTNPYVTEQEFVATYGLTRSAGGAMLVGPLALAAVSLAVLSPSMPISRKLAFALGGLTYPLYLLHQNIGYAVFAHFGSEQNKWLLLAGLLVALACLSLLIATAIEPPARRAIIGLGKTMRQRVQRLRARTA